MRLLGALLALVFIGAVLVGIAYLVGLVAHMFFLAIQAGWRAIS